MTGTTSSAETRFEHTGAMYDLLHEDSKPYESESIAVAAIVRSIYPEAKRLLDVACGTGEHLSYLSESFFVEGVDIAEPMLEVARAKVGAATFHRGDMTTFALEDRFDAITCLFSSVGYLESVDDLDRAIANMAAHLSPGGVLVVEPWHHTNMWRDNHTFAASVMRPERSVTRVMKVTIDGDHSVLDMHFGIADRDGVRSYDEQHRMRLFSIAEYVGAFERAGLTVEHDEFGLCGRGLFLGSRPLDS